MPFMAHTTRFQTNNRFIKTQNEAKSDISYQLPE